ncbi:hypothetical protein CUJ84_Chr002193 [Rhizobium leguminosarum]|uniref:Uncharacterized protein n=1 Tax=Rhizobium leguminosarum TaxID=384 RepID=A0A2K9Z2U5_RHILE|nr:hypothetical protein CUJ84_Chr002193 [Rhizobium leguminosarum]
MSGAWEGRHGLFADTIELGKPRRLWSYARLAALSFRPPMTRDSHRVAFLVGSPACEPRDGGLWLARRVGKWLSWPSLASSLPMIIVAHLPLSTTN